MKNKNQISSGISKGNVIAGLAVVVAVFALINISVTFLKIAELNEQVSGYASSGTGYVNITIVSQMIVNLSRDVVYWGPGKINQTYTNSTMWTNGDQVATVITGNWSIDYAKALVIQNIGNVNFSLNFTSDKNASSYIGGSNPGFQWNISNKVGTPCVGNTGWIAWNDWVNISLKPNAAGNTTLICKSFDSVNGNNEIYVDFLLRVPEDVPPSNQDTQLITTVTVTADTAL